MPTAATARHWPQRATAQGIRLASDDTWSDIFAKVLTERIEPYLGRYRPEFLHDYPRHEAALARAVAGYPMLAERFELYVCGVELANGFGELTDPAEQRRRLEAQMAEKAADLRRALSARRGFPRRPGPDAARRSGCALGFDRLVMLATGAERIDEVIWTPLPDSGAR